LRIQKSQQHGITHTLTHLDVVQSGRLDVYTHR